MKYFLQAALTGAILLGGVSFLPAAAAEAPVPSAEAEAAAPQFRSESLGFSLTMTVNRLEDQSHGKNLYRAYFPGSEMVMTVEVTPRRDLIGEAQLAQEQKELKKSVEKILEEQQVSHAKVREGKAGTLPAVIVDSRSGEDSLTRYYIEGPHALYAVVFSCREKDFKYNRKEMEAIMDTFETFLPVQTVAVPESSLHYELPAGMAVSSGNLPSVHSVLAMNRNLMSGVINKPLADSPYQFLPASLAGLTAEQKQAAEKGLRETVENDPSLQAVSAVSFTWGSFGSPAQEGVRMDYDDGDSHTENYLFVRDGQFISFAYVYPASEKDNVRAVIDRSVSSITW